MLALPNALESGWKAYRAIRRRWESMKVYLVAFQTLVALHYLPGSTLAVINPPAHYNAGQAIHAAYRRANDPHDVLLAYASTTTATDDLHRLSNSRGVQAEQILHTLLELAPTLVPSQRGADLVPLDEMIAMVVESASVLMEQHALSLTYYRSIMALPSTVPTPNWASTLSQVSQILNGLSTLRVDDDDDTPGGGENVANGCSNLLASMVRIVHEWSAMVERDGGASIPAIPALAGSSAPVFPFGLPETSSPVAMGSELLPMPDPVPIRSNSTSAIDTMVSAQGQMSAGGSAGGFQPYMPSSDRWMATDERSMSLPPQSASTTLSTPVLTSAPEYLQQAPSSVSQGAQGEPFNHMLTEMFGYSSYGVMGGQPPTPQQQQQQSGSFDPRGPLPPTPVGVHPPTLLHHGHLQHAPPHAGQQHQTHAPPHGPPPQTQPPQTSSVHGATFQLMPHGYDESGAH